jgi:hypothetical protein
MGLVQNLEARGLKHPVAMLIAEAIAAGGLPTPIGAAGTVLVSDGTDPEWGAVNLADADAVTGLLPAANVTTGTSGANIPLLNGVNTWSGLQTFSAGINLGNETLSVYDEFTFTPTIAFGGASVGVTYSLQSGGGVRIGTFAFFYAALALTSRGSSTGSATIGTLPLTPAVNVAIYARPSNYTIGAGLVPVYDTNVTSVRLRTFNPTTGNVADTVETQVDNDFSIVIAGAFTV